jgi:hypothetical protein
MHLQKDLKEFVELLNSHEVDYLIIGGYALAYHGHPRYTGDIDLLVLPTAENAEKIMRALDEFGFTSAGLSAADFTAEDQVIQLGRVPNRIDLVTSLSGVDTMDAWKAREQSALDGVPVSFLSRQHLIANKRATGRLVDLADLEALGEKPDA